MKAYGRLSAFGLDNFPFSDKPGPIGHPNPLTGLEPQNIGSMVRFGGAELNFV